VTAGATKKAVNNPDRDTNRLKKNRFTTAFLLRGFKESMESATRYFYMEAATGFEPVNNGFAECSILFLLIFTVLRYFILFSIFEGIRVLRLCLICGCRMLFWLIIVAKR